MSKHIKFDPKKFPSSSGVYLFKDCDNKILYVGKASNLRKRLKSYFMSKNLSIKTQVLVSKVKEIDFFCTNNEKEALLLEASLIKKHKPRYNIVLRDDKNYLLFKIDKTQKYPAIHLTRKVKKDNAIYFGPFVSAKLARETLKAINRIFPIRKCRDTVFKNRSRPCLQYYLKRCLAPCVFEVPEDTYLDMIKNLELFLSGKSKELVDILEKEMWLTSEKKEFEKAAILRDQIKAIKFTLERQAVVDPLGKDKDIITLDKDRDFIFICIVFVRRGKLLDHKVFKFKDPDCLEGEQILKEFIFQFYSPVKFIPEEVILPIPLEDNLLEEVLRDWKGGMVKIRCASSRKDMDLLKLAQKNLHHFRDRIEEKGYNELSHILGIAPNRIEVIDVSHIGGRGVLVGQVVFENGHLKKDDYRVYKMGQLDYTFDDYRALKEWVRRRINSGPPWPDLIVVDGGKGQMNSVKEEIKKYGFDWKVIAIAKPSSHEDVDKIYMGENERMEIYKGSNGLKFVQFLRDNAHRFVLSRQRIFRKKYMKSELENLPGIGPKTARLLWMKFGTLDRIISAGLKELIAIDGIGKKRAEYIYKSLAQLKDKGL